MLKCTKRSTDALHKLGADTANYQTTTLHNDTPPAHPCQSQKWQGAKAKQNKAGAVIAPLDAVFGGSGRQ